MNRCRAEEDLKTYDKDGNRAHRGPRKQQAPRLPSSNDLSVAGAALLYRPMAEKRVMPPVSQIYVWDRDRGL